MMPPAEKKIKDDETTADRWKIVVLEILRRVSTDRAALFRRAAACKRWGVLVTDRSFIRRCWPDESAGGPSTLLGFFNRQRMDIDDRPSYRLFFVPPPEGSVLGAHRRLLTSIVDGLPDDDSHIAEPLAARHGLVLVRLLTGGGIHSHMAVCDPFAGRYHVLPPLECRVSFVSCTILTGAECGRQHHRSLDNFKVMAVVLFDKPKSKDDPQCNLYTFSSTDSRWSAPTKCFDEIYRPGKRGFDFPQISSGNNVLCGTTAHWLVPYKFGHFEKPTIYYTMDVSSDTGHISLTELPPAATQPMKRYVNSHSTLGVTADGSLSYFFMNDEAHMRRIDVWKRGNGVNNEVIWLHSRVIELNLPRQMKLSGVCMLPVEKSHTLLVIDEYRCVHKINVETGVVEEQQFQNKLNILAMPMNMEWPTWFASRLG